VLNPKGALAEDAEAFGYKCANLKSIQIGSRQFEGGAFERMPSPGAQRKSMDETAPEKSRDSELEVIVEKRDNDTREPIVRSGDYAFEYNIISKDYLPLLKAQMKPSSSSTLP
jgi:hypothetical protein